MKKKDNKRKGIILFAVIASIILYMAGVFSGLYANQLIRHETQEGISSLKYETEQDLDNLKEYVTFLEDSLKNMQLEQTFSQILTQKERCQFSRISLKELFNQLGFYWDKLPYRIEEYERNNKLTEEYLQLKKQYAHISIQTWVLAKNQHDKCDRNIVHGLYFYSSECDTCVNQGKQLDRLNVQIKEQGKDLVMFPLDFNSQETIIRNLLEYYSINSTPAVMINDKVFQGRVYSAEEIIRRI